MSTNPNLSVGDEYHHSDGTVEMVFATESGRVLTVREYPTVDLFAETVEEAAYQGINEEVANLPPAEMFQGEGGNDSPHGGTGSETGSSN